MSQFPRCPIFRAEYPPLTLIAFEPAAGKLTMKSRHCGTLPTIPTNFKGIQAARR
jgi:hypothetical protein